MNGGSIPFFKENGNYQATHAINMAFKKLLNLSTPSEPFEAATKEYVDQRSHIIAVHVSYYGPLREGEYQFAFGGITIDPNGSSGFLVLQSGRIKKIQVKIDLEWDYYRFCNNCNVFTIVTKNPEIKDIASSSLLFTLEMIPGLLKYLLLQLICTLILSLQTYQFRRVIL